MSHCSQIIGGCSLLAPNSGSQNVQNDSGSGFLNNHVQVALCFLRPGKTQPRGQGLSQNSGGGGKCCFKFLHPSAATLSLTQSHVAALSCVIGKTSVLHKKTEASGNLTVVNGFVYVGHNAHMCACVCMGVNASSQSQVLFFRRYPPCSLRKHA